MICFRAKIYMNTTLLHTLLDMISHPRYVGGKAVMGMRPTSCHLMTRVVCRRSAGAAVSYSIPEAKVVLIGTTMDMQSALLCFYSSLLAILL